MARVKIKAMGLEAEKRKQVREKEKWGKGRMGEREVAENIQKK